MTETLENLYKVTEKDIAAAASMYSRAFFDYPFNIALAPNSSKREEKGANIYEFNFKMGLRYGEVYATSPKLEAVAIWIPSSSNKSPLKLFRSGGLILLRHASLALLKKVINIYEFTEERRKAKIPPPYMHLEAIAVDPDIQDPSLLGKLIQPMLARLKKEGIPIVHETQIEDHVAVYENLGFEVVDKAQIPNYPFTNWLLKAS